ncbi:MULTISPECIES: IS66 family insertion sequence element accessory protein TnpB [Lachnospiraceae]|jgi:transposase|uniref:Transposase n=1 Tax=Butyrivibrio hungatei TaxID=185008 RepID=A0A1G5E5I7_9FIRM|nr:MULTISPECIES: IS66 family insertion sequence element accessory protein TnpB [Lachnospiraceae]MBP5309558.1 IS66 family insertion sequence element accessory protein TnpB [Lachnospiraceae bacterium]MBQ4219868.1 IS66 family insertion sequence element accessory protein TnpB [Butyrivibrio sp.]SCY22294.1 transposase [Butyrivibrio hungatei]SFU96648.1 transposase [Butyrivibrio sp. M55]
MIGDITVADDIYIVCGYTDMRKSIDGLCAIVEDKLHMDPRSRAIFLFCGRRADRLKILMWEQDGFVLLYKRLSVAQGRYRWPRNKDEVRSLSWRELDWLLSGIDIEQPKAIRAS